MQLARYLVLICLLATACSPAPADIAPTSDPAPPASPTTTVAAAPSTTSTTALPTTTAGPDRGSVIGGALPDGTPYEVHFDSDVDRTVAGISGAIVMDFEDGRSWVIGISTFRPDESVEAGFSDPHRFSLPTGMGSFSVDIYEEIAEEIPDLEAFLASNITAGAGSKLPTLELTSPLRWATDDEVPLQMEVMYPGFVVRRGCGELATTCAPTGAVQLIAADKVSSPSPGLPSEPVWIESTAPRPSTNPSYLPPGPLSIRTDHDVLWTGDEMIIWGGADGDKLPHLTDGARFDPVSEQWRLVPTPPLENSTVTRAVWADDQMILVSREATLGFDPSTDEWTRLGDGLYPPTTPGFLVWTGEAIGAWTSDGIHLFDLSTGVWTQLPDHGFGESERWRGSLHVLDGKIVAVGLTISACGSRLVATWTDADWERAPAANLRSDNIADCSMANQTGVADGELVIWEDMYHPTMSFDPSSDEWTTIESIPLTGTEGASGSVPFQNGFLVPQWGEAAILDGATQEWRKVILAGQGQDQHMVWTGSELLMWGSACCFGDGRSSFISMDAWRWTPPEP